MILTPQHLCPLELLLLQQLFLAVQPLVLFLLQLILLPVALLLLLGTIRVHSPGCNNSNKVVTKTVAVADTVNSNHKWADTIINMEIVVVINSNPAGNITSIKVDTHNNSISITNKQHNNHMEDVALETINTPHNSNSKHTNNVVATVNSSNNRINNVVAMDNRPVTTSNHHSNNSTKLTANRREVATLQVLILDSNRDNKSDSTVAMMGPKILLHNIIRCKLFNNNNSSSITSNNRNMHKWILLEAQV